MKVEIVPMAWVNRVWSDVEGYLAEALQWSNGEYTVEHARALVTSGQWTLLVATDEGQIHGAATMSFFNRPTDRVAFITALGGPGITSEDTFAQLKVAAASQGATCLEGAARESIARLWRRYGFEEKYRLVGVKL
jgi:hypothetical protein